jgi:hypothetical protein
MEGSDGVCDMFNSLARSGGAKWNFLYFIMMSGMLNDERLKMSPIMGPTLLARSCIGSSGINIETEHLACAPS